VWMLWGEGSLKPRKLCVRCSRVESARACWRQSLVASCSAVLAPRVLRPGGRLVSFPPLSLTLLRRRAPSATGVSVRWGLVPRGVPTLAFDAPDGAHRSRAVLLVTVSLLSL
jgi:hypothetical protein